MTKEEKMAEKCFIKMFKENPVKIVQLSVLLFGREMVDSNAQTMKIKQESNIGDFRYEITVNAKIKKIKPLKPIPHA